MNPMIISYGMKCKDPSESCDGYADFSSEKEELEEHKANLVTDNPSLFIQTQDAKADAGKPRLTLVPRKIIWAIAKVREFGMKKYKQEDNWKRVAPIRYRNALFRHLLAYLDNPDGVDPESGLPILWHVATNAAFLIEMEWKDE